jgi:hypothetical protein
MIDDRLREAAGQLRATSVDDVPALGRRRRPITPLVVCAVLVLGGVWVARAALHRSTPGPPAVSTVTEAPTTSTAVPAAIIPPVPCFEQAPPPPTAPGQTFPDPTVPEGGYIRPDGSLVCGEERTAIIEGLLADVPVPAGFEVPSYGTTGPGWRSLVYEVSSAVVCAWLDEWFIAQDAGDTAGMESAAHALDTANTWDMLNRDFMASHAEYLQTWVDAVNGRGGVVSGAGDVTPTRERAESALACRWRHR